MQPKRVTIPEVSLINHVFAKYDYADCYHIEFRHPAKTTVDKCLPLVFICPGWVNALLKLRDIVVKPFGLKTSGGEEPDIPVQSFSQGDDLGVFSVLDRNEKEILMGIFDNHLDAGIALLLESNNGMNTLFLSTIVQYNNSLGKVYFFIVKPFHKLIVKTLLKRAVKSIQNLS